MMYYKYVIHCTANPQAGRQNVRISGNFEDEIHTLWST